MNRDRPPDPPPRDFLREIVQRDVASGKHGGRVRTRFPPEPNGYLHIGHAKAVCLDFGVAEEFGGTCNLRMDDTNPDTEDPAYVRAIEEDIRWLGFGWEGPIRYASDYFGCFYELALGLVADGLAYVDSLTEEEIREHRGTVTEPGRPGPYRDRSVEENLELFRAMRAGEFEDGAHVLRARIDLAASNMKMRDPLLYRIRHARHSRTGDEWPIYPFYDWAHCLEDAVEGITHSFCTLEFENNREVYDWVLNHTRPGRIGLADTDEPGAWDPRPRQYEFARLNLDYTVMSKRKLARLVRDGHVAGWDDPRMPTLAGLRRRGVPPGAIRAFCEEVGVSRADQRVQVSRLEHATRDHLNRRAPRVMCVLRPLRLVLENYPEGREEELEIPYFPRDVEQPPEGWPESRRVPFSREVWIEREDFREDPPKGYWRLAPGREVRLRHAYLVTCTDVVRDEATGEVVEVRCTYDPETRGGSAPDGRTVRGTLHWVSARHGLEAEVRLYDRLFGVPDPEAGGAEPTEALNPTSLEVVEGAWIEPSVADDPPETRYQFERQGYFVRDRDSGSERHVFNRTVPLRDTWARREAVGDHAAAGDQAAIEVTRAPESPKESTDNGVEPTVGDGTGRGRPRSETRERAREETPELAQRFERYREELGLSEEDADILTGGERTARFYEEALEACSRPQPVANWLIHELRGALEGRSLEDLPFGGGALGRLVELIEEGTISQPVGREVLSRMLEGDGDPGDIVRERGLERIADRGRLASLVEDVLARHPGEADRYRGGEERLFGFFIGQVMRASDGRADPRLLREILRKRLGPAEREA